MFYDNLQRACERNGLKMTPIVKECGGATGSIGAWKKGASPNADIVIKLATRLNASTDSLLLGNETPITKPELDDDSNELLNIYQGLDARGRTVVKAAAYTQQDRMQNDSKQEKGKLSYSQNDDLRDSGIA